MVLTSDGELPFQDYFVRLRCDIEVEDFRFAGIEHARPTREVENAMLDPGLTGILICPSNPFVSINPILSVPGMREQITKVSGPVVAVSPIIGGQAVKGPAAKMMAERDLEVSAVGVARCYQGLVSGFVIDEIDSHLSSQIESLGMFVHVTDTIMRDDSGRRRLAKECVMFMQRLGGRGP
jgi:LPPG:FO 2-phospho-L-lactate transferase